MLSADARWCVRYQEPAVISISWCPLGPIPVHGVGLNLSYLDHLFDATFGPNGLLHQELHFSQLNGNWSVRHDQ